MSLEHPLAKSFGYAIDGVKTALKEEPNFKIHLVIAFFSLFLATFLGFSPTEWIILFLTISTVLTLELINTTLEAIVDIISPEYRQKAKVAKDMAAAAVLVSAIAAFFVGIFLFLPKFLELYG